MTKFRIYIFSALLLSLLLGLQVKADAPSREYQVKAAFLYNFIMFVDWPQEKEVDENTPITIGIIGDDPFSNAFDPIRSKQAGSREIVIKRFKGLEELKTSGELAKTTDALKDCHLLFICRSEKKVVSEIVDIIKDSNVLVIGDMDGFLELGGGAINFVLQEEKVRFEVDLGAAKSAKLKIRSQLLKLAKRIIG
ncbi:MAG: YfiR family protein [Sedimentisphaerales bacterium]|nr:YfiR family protein [Sedimentisphaerales bacterium]